MLCEYDFEEWKEISIEEAEWNWLHSEEVLRYSIERGTPLCIDVSYLVKVHRRNNRQ